jgi:hypothetical protein
MLYGEATGAGIATAYWLDGWSSIPGRVIRFSIPQRPDRLWGLGSYPMAIKGSFLEGKAARV